MNVYLRFFLILILVHIYPSPAAGDVIGKHLLVCEEKPGHLRNCVFQEAVLSPRYPIQMHFKIQYTYKCSGTRLTLGIEQKNPHSPHFYPFEHGVHELSFEGSGPLHLVDKKPRMTLIGQYSSDCTLKVHHFSHDLSASSLVQAKDKLAHIETLSHLISETKKVSALAETIQTLVHKIDMGALSLLLKNLHSSTSAIAAQYKRKRSLKDAQAVTRILSHLEAAICDNPALREISQDLCGPITSNPQSLCSSLEDKLRQFSDDSLHVVEISSQALSQAIAEAFGMIFYGSEETKRSFYQQLCTFKDHLSGSLKETCHEFEN
ncbi:MAG: hypothetical protein KA436_06755 [Oligoflexales bacterium]|nr:hypothetical protein [Oligoflexales bacterium]